MNDVPTYKNLHNIDKDKLQRLLPKGTHHKVTDEIIGMIGTMETDTGMLQEYMEERVLSYLPVLKETKVDLREYVNAVKFCSLKKHMSNEKSWEICFPVKFKKLKDEGRWNTSHVSMYNSSTLVTKIDAQMAIEISIQYAPHFHRAMMKQVELSNGIAAGGLPVSAQVQHLAAKTILEVAAPIVDQNVNLKIGQSDEAKSSQEKMIHEMQTLARNQQALLEAGHSIEEVQKLNLKIEVDVDDGEAEYAEIMEEE